jgi:HNH endonuclease
MNRALLAHLRRLARDRCDYCQMPRRLDPLPFQVDHIIARQHGGKTILSNLAWSCFRCNKHKGPNIAGLNPATGRLVSLFHPRRQRWDRHFYWDGPTLIGRTGVGSATIQVLSINDSDAIEFRTELMDEGAFF